MSIKNEELLKYHLKELSNDMNNKRPLLMVLLPNGEYDYIEVDRKRTKTSDMLAYGEGYMQGRNDNYIPKAKTTKNRRLYN